ncbi:MAG TPA: hypothetical protein VD866_27975 [Urbifossiella sp.]|nr:hypothetical protein [Urbifossiella sp.]
MADTPDGPLRCVVHIGFAGADTLFKAEDADKAALTLALQKELAARIERLKQDLGLKPAHFLCGLSQLRNEADFIFTRVCAEAGIPQRILLPQPPDQYLPAADPGPDSPPDAHAELRRLISSSHVIEVRGVADSANRETRVEQTDFEIARLSDIVVYLTRDPEARPNDARDLMAQAVVRRTRTLELIVEVTGQQVRLKDNPHKYEAGSGEPVVPRLPEEVADVRLKPAEGPLPSCSEYLVALKPFSSRRARLRKWFFRVAAMLIVSCHIAATVAATLFLVFHRHDPPPAGPPADAPAAAAPADPPAAGTPANAPAANPNVTPADAPANAPAAARADPPASAHDVEVWMIGLLVVELALLAVGAGVHWVTHHREWSQTWATIRTLAEVARSAAALADWHAHLAYLFQLPLPARLRPVLRTVNVLHMRTCCPPGGWSKWEAARDSSWEKVRDTYVARRLAEQIRYYAGALGRAKRWVRSARLCFWVMAGLAVAAVVVKVAHYAGWAHLPDPYPGVLSVLTIVAPVLAVGALSLAAAMDCFAQAHIYSEMVEALKEQERLLKAARSPHEFERLAFETEGRLLGETVNWYFRRSFAEVT